MLAMCNKRTGLRIANGITGVEEGALLHLPPTAFKATCYRLNGFLGLLTMLQLADFSLSPSRTCFTTAYQGLDSPKCVRASTLWLSNTPKTLGSAQCHMQPAIGRKTSPCNLAFEMWWARCQRRSTLLQTQRIVLLAWAQTLNWLAATRSCVTRSAQGNAWHRLLAHHAPPRCYG